MPRSSGAQPRFHIKPNLIPTSSQSDFLHASALLRAGCPQSLHTAALLPLCLSAFPRPSPSRPLRSAVARRGGSTLDSTLPVRFRSGSQPCRRRSKSGAREFERFLRSYVPRSTANGFVPPEPALWIQAAQRALHRRSCAMPGVSRLRRPRLFFRQCQALALRLRDSSDGGDKVHRASCRTELCRQEHCSREPYSAAIREDIRPTSDQLQQASDRGLEVYRMTTAED